MVSIIIVNYRVKSELFECIESVYASKPKTPFEIIVVDNDEEKTIGKDLRSKFQKVVYVLNENKGFGQGNNVGASRARGEYLFFLNPDTKLLNNLIDELVNYLNKHKDTAVAAPLLFDKKNSPYQLQGTRDLTPLRAILSLSFLNKFFPRNKVYRDYYLFDWDKKSVKEVDAVPGTAFVIRKKVFEQIGGFDEKFFLYFEEFDLCERVKSIGWKIYMIPSSKVFHKWGASTNTKSRKYITDIFLKSRFYYFKKHFGLLQAILTESILRINKYTVILALAIAAGAFLRLYRIDETMPFISDQGWFFLSARDMLLTGNIPLVGIASSHPWLHQGALWTYMLAAVLAFFGFNPLNGVFLSVFIDALAIILIYKTGKLLFSTRVGAFASLMYAMSPLVIDNARMPYHTSPIPFFVILFIYFLYRWISGSKNSFLILIFILSMLYNLELATVAFWIILLFVLIYGLFRKLDFATTLLNKRMVLLSILVFIISMLPILIYDLSHNFPQTLGFLAWIGYRILVLFGYPPLHPEIPQPSFSSFIIFTINSFHRLIFIPNLIVTAAIIIVSLYIFYRNFFINLLNKKNIKNYLVLAIVVIFSVGSFLVSKIPSAAYLPMLFPGIILLTAVSFDLIKSKYTTWIIVILIICGNGLIYFLEIDKARPVFKEQIDISKDMVSLSKGKAYNLKGNLADNYEYLTWRLGHGPSEKRQQLLFIIEHNSDGFTIKKEIQK